MLVALGLVFPVLDSFFERHFYFRLDFVSILRNTFSLAPVFIGLWLAFALYEKAGQQPDTTPDAPSTANQNGVVSES